MVWVLSIGPDRLFKWLESAESRQLKVEGGARSGQTFMEGQINLISSDFVDAGVPLTTEQSTGLTQAFLKAWYWPGRDLSDRPVDYNNLDPNTVLSLHDIHNLDNAAQVLTPAQLNALRDLAIQSAQTNAIKRQYRMLPGS